MNAESLRGLRVVSLAESVQLGRVLDVLVEPDGLRVEALLLEAETGRFALPLRAIRSVGRDAVTIERAEQAEPLEAGSALRRASQLYALPVGSSAGDYFGDVAGLDFDLGTGRLLSLTVRYPNLLGLSTTTRQLSPRAIRTLGDRLVTVDLDRLEPG